ncbi:BspA family leucine-rich repeat surface protein [Mycoplasma cottewii]|uniref:BspA family leucine-rich repeat surface protein n=1 Tax=Mycoplasma cottewii TaxID=51364 RepID=A0ABY5TZW6_9MOLU|nr:BspA family leucine-rich repeat surface protein [Mycoplasma cottewii]UWD35106.1 BspA family leucine-rich repeat surface protein [Mycoplasma cottewii]
MKLKAFKLTLLSLTLASISASVPFAINNINNRYVIDNDTALIRNYIKEKEQEYRKILDHTNQLKTKLENLDKKIITNIQTSNKRYEDLLNIFNNELISYTEFKINNKNYILAAIDKQTNEFVELENFSIDDSKHKKIEQIEKVSDTNLEDTTNLIDLVSKKISSLSKILTNVVTNFVPKISNIFKEMEELNNLINRTINKQEVIDLVGTSNREIWNSLSVQEKVDLLKNKVDGVSNASLDITKKIEDADQYKEKLEDKLNGFSISTTELSLKIKKYWNLIIKHKFKQTDNVEVAINYIKEILTEQELNKVSFLTTRNNEKIEGEAVTLFINETKQDGSKKTKTIVLDEVKFTYDDDFINSIEERVSELFKNITLPKDKKIIKNSELLDIIKNNFSNEKEKLAIHLNNIDDYNKIFEDKIQLKYSYDSQIYEYKIPERKIEWVKPTIYLDSDKKIQETFDTDLSTDKYSSVWCIKQIGYFKDESSNLIKAVRMPKNVIQVPDKLPEEIESTESMFENAGLFDGNLSTWDVSNVKSMKSMFKNTRLFNGDLSSWNVSSLIDASGMFQEAGGFNRPLNSWAEKTRNIENMESMFEKTSNFNHKLNDWNTSKVTNMKAVFKNNENFNADISSWNTSKVTNMESMFEDADKFNVDISNWDVSNVTTMHKTFSEAENFKINLAKWNVLKVEDMSYMFYKTTIHTNFSEWSNKLSKVKNMEYMFQETSIDRNEIEKKSIASWDISSVESLKGLFQDSKYNLNLNGKFGQTMSKVKDLSYMFYNKSEFNKEIKDWDLSSAITLEKMFSQNEAFNQKVDFSKKTNSFKNLSGMFKDAKQFNELINFSTINVTDMSFMFCGAKNLTDKALEKLFDWRNNTNNVQTVKCMFANTENFVGNSLKGNFDFKNVRDFSSMFESATLFNGEIARWRFAVNDKCDFNINMQNMFKGATNFDQDLSKSWRPRLKCVENMNGMFNGATSFNQNISIWLLPKILGGTIKTDDGRFIEVEGNNNYKCFNANGNEHFTLASGNLPKGMQKIEGIR